MADLKAPRPGAAAAEASSLTMTGSKGGGEKSASSGFVLKLFQMVNGAPDDILSVSLQISFISIVLCSPTCLVGVEVCCLDGVLISHDFRLIVPCAQYRIGALRVERHEAMPALSERFYGIPTSSLNGFVT